MLRMNISICLQEVYINANDLKENGPSLHYENVLSQLPSILKSLFSAYVLSASECLFC